MGCNCGKNRTRYEVRQGAKVVFTTGQKLVADSVAARYPGSTVVDTKA